MDATDRPFETLLDKILAGRKLTETECEELVAMLCGIEEDTHQARADRVAASLMRAALVARRKKHAEG